MDLNAAKMFVTVVQCGSLYAAASQLQLPLAIVSRHLRELERSLDTQLLHDLDAGPRLTEAGTRLYEHASRGVEAMAEGEQALSAERAPLQGLLRVSLPPAFEIWWKLLADFQRRYPLVQVAVYTSERHVDLVEDGIDVALRIGNIAWPHPTTRLLDSYRHRLVASPALLERLGTPQTPEDLQRFPCAVWSHNTDTRERWQLGEQCYIPDPVFSANDYLHLRQLALGGKVLTELPAFLAAEALHDGRLLAVLPRLPMPEQPLHLLYPDHRPPSNVLRAYLAFCQDWLLRNPLPA